MSERVYTVMFPFGGMGGGALGFKEAQAHLFGSAAHFRVIGGIDFEKLACQDFEKLVGAPSLCADIAHLTPLELRQLSPAAPDVVFMSPPCKGASGLLGLEKSKTPKYQAMNRLALDWIELMLSTWDRPPRLVLLENVPRLKQRAASMLTKVRGLLRKAGYVLHDGFHECGELGGLAQIRKRYLLVARHAGSTAPLLYQPPKVRVRACGEVLGPLPMPGDPAAGPMHALPRLSWLNWVRLALIPAGGDWRDLDGVLQSGQARREVFKRHGVQRWEEPSETVAGPGSNGPGAVADPRAKEWFGNVLRVNDWDAPAPTVTAGTRPMNGGQSVADPRIPRFKGSLGVNNWEEPNPTVTGESHPSNGSNAVADPRLRVGRAFDHGYGVLRWDESSSTVAGGSQVGQGAYSVADGRLDLADAAALIDCDCGHSSADHGADGDNFTNTLRTECGECSCTRFVPRLSVESKWGGGGYGVLGWQEAAGTITGNGRVGTGKFSVADPRKPPPFTPLIIAADGTWHRPLTTLELAVLQSFPAVVNGEPLVLAGKSISGWRERIGNAVPPKTAKAIAERMLVCLLQADLGAFTLSSSGNVWVEKAVIDA